LKLRSDNDIKKLNQIGGRPKESLGSRKDSLGTRKETLGRRKNVIAGLPDRLFYNTGISACLWFMKRREKNKAGKNGILFIDARSLGHMINRRNRELSEQEIHTIAGLYHEWTGNGNERNYMTICYTNQQINAVIPHDAYQRYNLYCYLKVMRPQLEELSTGDSILLNLDTAGFSRLLIPGPPQSQLKIFYGVVHSIFKRIHLNSCYINHLIMARNFLQKRIFMEFFENDGL
jgi:hypothetical protein